MTDSFTTRVRGLRSGDAGKLSVLMATAFIDMVGGLMVFPLFPFYASRFGANGFEVNMLITAFSVVQLASAPFWGRVSDRYGRKPALLFGLGASAVAYIVFAFANSYWLLLASRVVQGAGGGTTGVIQAYVADAVEPRNRARSLGWLSSATNLGVVLGPLLGAAAITLGGYGPGLVAAALCVVNIGFAARFLHETHGAIARERSRRARTPLQAVKRVLARPKDPASRLIWMYAIGMGAFYGINATLSLFLKDRFGVTAQTIGFFYAYVGALSILFRLGLLGPVVDRLGEVKTARLGATLLALGLAIVPVTHRVPLPGLLSLAPLALAVALIPLGTAFNFPSVTGLLSRVVGEHERGLYMGVQQTYAGVARALYPLYAGFAWDTLGVVVPFWTSAVIVGATVWMGFGLEGHVAAAREEERPPLRKETTKEQPAIVE